MKGVEKYMRKVTKYGRRMRMLFAVAATMAGIGVMMLIPWDKGFAKAEDTFYSVIVNDYEVGNVVSKEEAEAIYAKTCDKLEAENDQSVYVDASLVVVENDAVMGKATDSAQLEQNMYHELKNSLVPAQETAYSVTIEDTSVVLSSLEEVTEVVNTVADQYDTENRYQAVIEEENDARFGEATCELVQASIEPVNKPMVMAAESTDTAAVNTQESLSLGSQIEIVQTYADKKEVLSVEEAVQTLQTVLSVVTVNQEVYEETIDFTTEYVTDENEYTDYMEVIQPGQAGVQKVTAQVNYQNGVETGRTVLNTEVLQQPVTQIIKVGTKEKPQFVLPLKNPVISDVFGPRWGRVHRGMDFACNIGTEVLASAGGIVEEATYRNDYGYTVVINHGNGMKTRYAHMSKLLVSNGEEVIQGQTVGLSGNTGDSTGPHLHFELIQNGTRIDPQPYLYQ